MYAETGAILTKCIPFYEHHSGGTELRCTHCWERTLVWGFTVGGGDQYVLQAFVQSQIWRSGCCLNSKRSSSFMPMFLFVYFLTVPKFILLYLNRHISYLHMLSCRNGVEASEAVCGLLFSLSLSLSLSLPAPCSPLQHSFAMPFHPLPSYCWAPFELFK